MKQRQWQIKRTVKPTEDAQKRWDRAYLLILKIAQSISLNQEAPKVEVNHANSDLCTGVNSTASSSPNH